MARNGPSRRGCRAGTGKRGAGREDRAWWACFHPTTRRDDLQVIGSEAARVGGRPSKQAVSSVRQPARRVWQQADDQPQPMPDGADLASEVVFLGRFSTPPEQRPLFSTLICSLRFDGAGIVQVQNEHMKTQPGGGTWPPTNRVTTALPTAKTSYLFGRNMSTPRLQGGAHLRNGGGGECLRVR